MSAAELEELGPPEHPDWSVDPEGQAQRTVMVGGVEVTLQVERAFERRWAIQIIDAGFRSAPPSEPVSDLDSWQLDAEAGLLWRDVPKLGASAYMPAEATQDVRDQVDAMLEYSEALLTIRTALGEAARQVFAL